MWSYEFSTESTASPMSVYLCYEDVPLRCTWDNGLMEVTLDGPFAAGTKGTMVIEGQGAFSFTIIAADPGKLFIDETELPDMRLTLRFDHELEPLANGGTKITHRLKVTGPNVDSMGEEVGRMIAADFPQAVTSLARLAEQIS